MQELALFKNGQRTFSGASSRSAKEAEGDVEDLTGARVVTTMIVNGVPQTAIEVVEGVRKFRWAPVGCSSWIVWACVALSDFGLRASVALRCRCALGWP